MGKALAAWLMVAGALAATTGPRDIVQGAVGRVIAVVQDDLPSAQRRVEIRRIAGDLFDFDEMARRTLPRQWTLRTAAEQAEFVRLFTDVLERSYVDRIEGWSGERVVYTGESIDGRYATVRSKVVTRRRTEIGLDYRLLLRDGRWRAYDVLVDGVSSVATYRGEFDRILQHSQWNGLMQALRRRVMEPSAVVRGPRG